MRPPPYLSFLFLFGFLLPSPWGGQNLCFLFILHLFVLFQATGLKSIFYQANGVSTQYLHWVKRPNDGSVLWYRRVHQDYTHS